MVLVSAVKDNERGGSVILGRVAFIVNMCWSAVARGQTSKVPLKRHNRAEESQAGCTRRSTHRNVRRTTNWDLESKLGRKGGGGKDNLV